MYFTFKIRDSRFLSGVPWPEPDYVYQSLPTRPHLIRDEAADMPHYESVVREKLATDFGISQQKLDAHIDRGARSAVIGAYRILMHKQVGGVAGGGGGGGTSTRETSSISNGNAAAAAAGQSPRRMAQSGTGQRTSKADKNVKKKSKACIIL